MEKEAENESWRIRLAGRAVHEVLGLGQPSLLLNGAGFAP